PAHGRDAEVDEHDDGQVVLVARADAVVDRVPHEQPAACLAGSVADADEQQDERPRLASLEVAPESLPERLATAVPGTAFGPARHQSLRGSWQAVAGMAFGRARQP